MKHYLFAMRLPLIVAVANAGAFHFTWSAPGATVLFNVVRIVVALWAGYAIVKAKRGTVLIASFAGPIVLFIDHVLIGGTLGALTYNFSQVPSNVLEGTPFPNHPHLAYFLGIVVSFLMFFPIAMAIAAGGGILAKVNQRAV